MSLQNLFSFDHIASGDLAFLPRVISKGVFANLSTTSGRDNTQCLRCTSNVSGADVGFNVAIDQNPEVVVGAWVTFETLDGGTPGSGDLFLAFCNPASYSSNNSNAIQVGICARMDGSIAAVRGNATVGAILGVSAPGVVLAGTTSYYIEARVLIGAVGQVTVKVNQTAVLTLTGVNTQIGASSDVTYIIFGAASTMRWDDVAIITGEVTGDGWTTFVGIIKIHAKLVNAIGDYNEWTPSAPTGVNWQNVDENTPNTTDYNETLTVGLIDTYHLEDVSFNPIAVETDLYMRKPDSGASSVAHVARYASINYVSSEVQALSTTYRYYKKVYTINPNGNPWTMDSYNALQAGPKKAV